MLSQKKGVKKKHVSNNNNNNNDNNNNIIYIAFYTKVLKLFTMEEENKNNKT